MLSLLSTIRKAVRCICLLLLAALVVTPLAQIVMRGVFNVPHVRRGGAGALFPDLPDFRRRRATSPHEGGQIRMEEFQVLIPPTPRWLLQLAIELAAVAVFAVFFVACVVTILQQPAKPDADAGDAVLAVHGAAGRWARLLLVVETTAMFVHTWRAAAGSEANSADLRGLRWKDLSSSSHSWFFSCWDFRSCSRSRCRASSIC